MKIRLFIAALIIGIVVSLVSYASYFQGFESGYAEGESVGYDKGELAGYEDGLDTIEDELIFTILSRLFPIGYECHIFPKEDPWSGYIDYYFYGEFIKRVPILEPTSTPEPTRLRET